MPSSDQETYDLYADQLKSLKLGYALYEPEPNEGEGPIEIADIGYTDSGRFVRFANAFQPQPGIPAIDEKHHAILKLNKLDSGVMASRRVSHKKIEVGISASSTEPNSGASIGTSIKFSCESDRGASLITRHRSKIEKAKFHNVLQDHFIEHLFSYKRIADNERLPIKNLHDILLVVRRVMTGDWATIVFHSGAQESDVSFDIKVATLTASGRIWGKWSEFTSFPKRHGPTRSIPLSDDEEPPDNALDQCIFIAPFRVSDIVWYKKVKLALMQKSGSMVPSLPHPTGNGVDTGQTMSPDVSQASLRTGSKYHAQPYESDEMLAAHEVLAFHAFNASHLNFDLICIDEKDVQHFQPDACTIENLRGVSMDLTVVPAYLETPLSSMKVGRLFHHSSTSEDQGRTAMSSTVDFIACRSEGHYDSYLTGPQPRSSSAVIPPPINSTISHPTLTSPSQLSPTATLATARKATIENSTTKEDKGTNLPNREHSPKIRVAQHSTSLVPHISSSAPTGPQDNPSSSPNSYLTSPPANPPSQAYVGAQRSPTYSQRPGFQGQYTMSQQPPPQSLFSSQAQYAYSHPHHHAGMHSPDRIMPPHYPSIGYSAASLAPPAPSRSLYPVQQFSRDDGSSNAPVTVYDPSPPSGLPHLSQTTSPYIPQHASSFPSLNHPTVTATSQFTHSTPSWFHSQYPNYAVPPFTGNPSPDDSQHQGGTWPYVPQAMLPAGPSPVPPGTYNPGHRSFPGLNPVPYPQMGRPELDTYGNPATASTSGYSSIHPSSRKEGTGYALPSFPASSSGTLLHPQSSSHSGPPKENMSPHGHPLPASHVGPLVVSSAGESGDRSNARRPYHPNPPAQRSKWVMWVGNVPSDATHDELWRFFTPSSAVHVPQPLPINTLATLLPVELLSPEDNDTLGESSGARSDGVASIFLISRSNCAFVNYSTEAHLLEGVRRFNGIPLRPSDPRCQKLVCRVRREDVDLRTGIGGQRDMGIHSRWVMEQKEKERIRQGGPGTGKGRDLEGEDTSEDDSLSESSHASSDFFRKHSDGGRSSTHQSSSSGSYASTSSGFLKRHFPTRYFILKSSSLENLETSVQRGLWATQPHNEAILNQAYRTSTDVFLIFGVNLSGEFFGYARLAGPIGKSQERFSWASRDSSHSHPPSASLLLFGRARVASSIAEEKEGEKGDPIFSPEENRLPEDFPQPSSDQDMKRLNSESANLDAGPRKQELGERSLPVSLSAPPGQSGFRRPVELDPEAPLRAVRDQQKRGPARLEQVEDESRIQRKDMVAPKAPDVRYHSEPPPTTEGVDDVGPIAATGEGEPAQWGTPFKVEWVNTQRLPFYRTVHLRNPWNHDREVKVSRDGTELDPVVGQALLDEWTKPEPVATGA